MTLKDLPELFQLRSDQVVMKYIDRKPADNIEDAKTFLKIIDSALEEGDGIAWGIFLKSGPEKLVGNVSFWRLVKEHYRAEIGYMLLPQYWGNGYITETLRTILKFGFEEMNLHTVEARINPGNAASRKVLLSAGFEKEAYFREDYCFNGKFGDTEVFGIINPYDN